MKSQCCNADVTSYWDKRIKGKEEKISLCTKCGEEI